MAGMTLGVASLFLGRKSNNSSILVQNTTAFAGRDNAGTQQVFHAPVTINQGAALETGQLSQPSIEENESAYEKIARARRGEMLLQDAAQYAYESAERDGWLDQVVGISADPHLLLNQFKYMMKIQAGNGIVILKGIRPPSTQYYAIPADTMRNLHPENGTSTLLSIQAGRPRYDSVTISKSDLEKVIAIYRAIAESSDG